MTFPVWMVARWTFTKEPRDYTGLGLARYIMSRGASTLMPAFKRPQENDE